MPIRKTILAIGEIYHIFNHSIGEMPIFKGQRECSLFLEAVRFYLQPKPPTKFSIYRTSRDSFPFKLDEKLVTIINYCLMPNHFHFTLRQEKENGVRKFIQRVSNSFAHFFNLKYKKRGPVFEGKFKAVRVENDEQLLHLSRYIHLNPVTAFLVEKPEDYPYSSYLDYLGRRKSDIIDPSLVIKQFSSLRDYQGFVIVQKDYQRSLNRIKYLILG